MQVRYQAALRPDLRPSIAERPAAPVRIPNRLAQRIENALDFLAQRGCGDLGCRSAARLGRVLRRLVQAVPRTAYGEPLLVQQLADASDQQHLMVLIIAPVPSPLDRLELGEF